MGYLDLFYFACQDAGVQLPPPSLMKPALPSELVSTEEIQKCLEENQNLIQAILEYQNQGKTEECNQLQDLLQKNLLNLAAIADVQPPPSGPSQVLPSPVAQQGNYMHPPQGAMMQHPFQGSMMQQPPQGAMWQQPPQGRMMQQQQQQVGADISKVLPSSVAQQGNYMMQHPPQGAMMQEPAYGAAWQQPPQGQSMQQQLLGAGISKVPKANASRSQDQQQQLLHFQQQQQIFGQMAMRARANNGMHGMNQILQHGFGTSGSSMDARGIKKDSPESASASGQRKKAARRGNRK